MRLLLLLVLVGCGNSDAGDIKRPIDGETVYMRACAACHQADGRGMEGVYPPLAQADYLGKTTKEVQIGNVLHGMSGPLAVNGLAFNAPMPPSDLGDEHVAAVLTYIRTSWGNTLEPVRTEEVARYRKGPR